MGSVLATVSDSPVSVDGTNVDHYDPILSTAQKYYPLGSLLVAEEVGLLPATGYQVAITSTAIQFLLI